MDAIRYVQQYVSFINDFENQLKSECNVQSNIYSDTNVLFTSNGKVGDYDYHFHGAGCRITKKHVICEYDFLSFTDNLGYQFSLWKIKVFIESFYNIVINEIKLKEELESLVSSGYLKKVTIEDRVFDVFIINCFNPLNSPRKL